MFYYDINGIRWQHSGFLTANGEEMPVRIGYHAGDNVVYRNYSIVDLNLLGDDSQCGQKSGERDGFQVVMKTASPPRVNTI